MKKDSEKEKGERKVREERTNMFSLTSGFCPFIDFNATYRNKIRSFSYQNEVEATKKQ